jgi:hypothetical protein
MIPLTEKETAALQAAHWKLLEADQALKALLNETVIRHGCDIEKKQFNITPDFKNIIKLK